MSEKLVYNSFKENNGYLVAQKKDQSKDQWQKIHTKIKIFDHQVAKSKKIAKIFKFVQGVFCP